MTPDQSGAVNPAPPSLPLNQVLQPMPGKRVRVNPALVAHFAAYLLTVARQYEAEATMPARRGDRLNRLRVRGQREAAQRVIDTVSRLCDALLETVDSDDLREIADTMGLDLSTGLVRVD